jgi:hypothetical protein
MPPFQYRTVKDPYVGDITRLMGAGPAAEARSIREVGNIRAEEAQQKGAITAGLVGNLTQIASSGYDRYRETKADEIFQRLVGKKTQASYAAVGEDRMRPMDFSKMPKGPTREDIFSNRPTPTKRVTPDDVPQTGAQWDQRYGGVSPAIDPGPSPEGQMGEIVDIPTPEATTPLPEAPVSPPAVPGEPATQTMAGLLGTVTPEPTPRLFEHVFNDGRFDVQTLPTALAREGVSRDHIDRLMGRAVEYNTAVTAQNDETRARGLDARLLEKDRLLSRLLLQDEDPSLEMVLSIPGVSPQEAVNIHNTIRSAKQAQANLENAQGENFLTDIKTILALARFLPDEESGNRVVQESMKRITEAGNLTPEVAQVAQQITTMDGLENFLTQYEGIGAASPTLEEERNRVFAEWGQAKEEFGENHHTVQALENQLADINEQRQLWARGPGELPAVEDPETQPEEYDRLSREKRGLQTELAALADPESPEGLTLAREIESLGAQMAQITGDVRDYATQIKPVDDEEGDRDIDARLEALGFVEIPNRKSVMELLSSDAMWLNPTSGPYASFLNLVGSTAIIGDLALRRDGGAYDEWGGPEAIERSMGQRKRLELLERQILDKVVLNDRFAVREVENIEKKLNLVPTFYRSAASIRIAVKEIDQTLRVKLKEAVLDEDDEDVIMLANLIIDLGVSPGGGTAESPSVDLARKAAEENPPQQDAGPGREWQLLRNSQGQYGWDNVLVKVGE